MTFNPLWTWAVPAASWIILGLWLLLSGVPFLPLLIAAGLLGSVVAAVHHAEVIAHKVGEPFGTLVLALSVTIIESGLIVSMMLRGGDEAMALPRDTLFAATMIILNGIIGFSLLTGGRKNNTQRFNLEGTTEALCTISMIVVISLVLPNFTSGKGVYSPTQLIFLAALTFGIYIAFTRFQTILHSDFFTNESEGEHDEAKDTPDLRTTLISLGLLIVSLVAVVISAKAISPNLESMLGRLGAPAATLGIVIAAIVLLPELGASVRAARANNLQTSLNLALGSALASIGLTVPVVALLAVWMGWPLRWGLDGVSMVLLALSLFVVSMTLSTGTTTRQPGILHLALFLAYLFFSFIP